ncbi:TIGR03086 family metal-binding protein [Rhodococcus aetherivorans]|uniref:TIGR03086 family metal-binding protein n=1 Tax=Rhodococcus aetherivorans TaxID=191292 RepID=UPI000622CE92|nr:TIGR03086 family metal-binding protein [Rhodococcus aetherivorans]AKE91519.1 hypothetical protein AAT18_22305 [Rhodococcus aetherivorans]
MTEILDLAPAAHEMARLVGALTHEQLARPTPCAGTTIGDLVDHVGGLSLAFTAAAGKAVGDHTGQGPSADASRLGDDWRTRIPGQVLALAEAWRDPGAWTGTTQAGGIDLPGHVAGIVALDELVIHGWDIATASGRRFSCDPAALAACLSFVAATTDEERAAGGLFGPAVAVSDDAPDLDRLIGLSGRDPSWRPPPGPSGRPPRAPEGGPG